jgi:lipopolysaccharide assembly outer membrane protein LptD (OstA)
MKQLRKFRSNYFSAGILTAAIIFLFYSLTCKTAHARVSSKYFYTTLTTRQDTVKPNPNKDSLQIKKDSVNDTTVAPALADTIPGEKIDTLIDTLPNEKIDTFSFKVSKDSLDAPINYEAEDSAVVLVQDKKILLYGKTKTDYKDIELTAPEVELDQQTEILTAYNKVDSTGDIIERANFKQGESEFQSDTIHFNFKTQKGLTKNTYTQNGGAFIHSTIAKKVSPTTMYAKNGVMTTCDLDDPHFGFHYDKIKIINNKLAITGPIHPEFEGVPIPIYLPFGIFPLTKGRHSGFIAPTLETNEEYGLGLVNGGYYKVLSDYWDVALHGDVYSYGGWRATISPEYRKRYKYNGGFNITVQSTKLNFKGDPDYSKNTSYSFTWHHTMDSRARPGTNFSASVNASSTRFNRYVSNNPLLNFQNQQTSSITYSKTWGNRFNLTMSANHNQNNNLHYITLNLPNVGFTVNTIYPFQKKEAIGTPKWYEKIGIGYNGTFNNTVSFYDTLSYGKNGVKPLLKYLLDTAQWSYRQNIPMTLALPTPPILGGAVIITPGFSYNPNFLQNLTTYRWDSSAKKVDTIFRKGLFLEHQAGFSLNINTAIYGMYEFKNSKIVAIRHTMRPQLGFSYTPDLNRRFIQEVQVDTTGRKITYNQATGSFLSYTGGRRAASINFTLDNNLEMKVRSPKDTTTNGIKKVKLIDGFGLTTNYNLLADSFALSNPTFYFRSNLFEKVSITANATLNPYDYDARGLPVNHLFSHNGKFYWGRLSNGSVSLSTNFKSKPKDKEVEEQRNKQLNDIMNDPNLINQQDLMDYMQQNPGDFVDFNINWSLNLGLSLSFYNRMKSDYSGFEKQLTSSLNFSGNFLLSPKWNINANGYYDLTTNKIQMLTMNISRDMHCWKMTISVTPVGLYRFFSINISPKASILQDLKINRTRTFTNF